MISLYFHEYKNRIISIFAALSLIAFSVILVFAACNKMLVFCSDELSVYRNSTFRYGYVLNYSIGLQDEYLFPDADILLYADAEKSNRIVASVLMEIPSNEYTRNSLIQRVSNSPLEENEIQISANVAGYHNLDIGSVVFGEYPYSSELVRLTVVDIGDANYDILNPRAANCIGIVLLGNNRCYQESISIKCLVFSDVKLSDKSAEFPQLIDSVFSRDQLIRSVVFQGMPFVLWMGIVLVANAIFQCAFVYRQSVRSLTIRQRKGMQHNQAKGILIFEFLLLMVLPTLITAFFVNILSLKLLLFPFGLVMLVLIGLLALLAVIIYFGYRQLKR